MLLLVSALSLLGSDWHPTLQRYAFFLKIPLLPRCFFVFPLKFAFDMGMGNLNLKVAYAAVRE